MNNDRDDEPTPNEVAMMVAFVKELDAALSGSEIVARNVIEFLDAMARGVYPSKADIRRRRAACQDYLNGVRALRQRLVQFEVAKGRIDG